MVYLLFVLGFVLLVVGAGWLIDGALKLARRFGASRLESLRRINGRSGR